jgi:hypothetical protein
VSTSTIAPAFDTIPVAVVSNLNDGYTPVDLLTRKVLLNS